MKASALACVGLLLSLSPLLADPPKVTVGYLPPGVKIVKSYDESPSPAPAEPEVPEDRPASRHFEFFVKDIPGTESPNGYLCISELTAADLKKFPSITEAARELKALLADRPAPAALLAYKKDGSPVRDLPDFPFPDAYQALRSHFTYLDAPWGSGYAEVVQFAQDETRAANEFLAYYLQGITKDGKYYISASFPITHPDLPNTYDEAILADPNGTMASDIKKLHALPSTSFHPPLLELQKMIKSINITGK